MNIMKYRKLWYFISLALIVPGTLALIFWGLKPSIDFTGGTKMELGGVSDTVKVREVAEKNGLEAVTVQKIGTNDVTLRFKEISDAKHKEITSKFKEELGESVEELSFETVGPVISAELTRNSFVAVGFSSLVIIIYIAISFRKVPYPAKSWEFGVGAVLATLHDALLLVGVFAILGHFYNIEIDPLIITAILTVIGFSVHDTIVIFDRIRENLIKKGSDDFEAVVNDSVVEMLHRTLNTSFLAWLILLVLFIFGGATIRWFVFALVIGILSGTYSSILNASPLLVTWQDIKKKYKKS